MFMIEFHLVIADLTLDIKKGGGSLIIIYVSTCL